MILRFFYFILFALIISCNSKSDQGKAPVADTNSNSADMLLRQNGADIEPALRGADSLEIIFYDNPDGDSLRYARFYTYFPSNDSSIVLPVIDGLSQPFEMITAPRNCRSEGKIYLYGKKEPIKTIYFSSRKDTCQYLYFIKDGNFLYFKMPVQVTKLLKENKSRAIKP